MAIIPCRECKSDVSDQARFCPSCGATITKEVSNAVGVAAVLGLFSLSIIVLFSIIYGYKYFQEITLVKAPEKLPDTFEICAEAVRDTAGRYAKIPHVIGEDYDSSLIYQWSDETSIMTPLPGSKNDEFIGHNASCRINKTTGEIEQFVLLD
ncbi:hypothetical protein ACTVPA_19100 [Serratia bockelmannii]|uniref:hypothetical protein n=1 Tax=Serratia bockelmannii TaxID=2703793 RepID=UPI003E33AEFD